MANPQDPAVIAQDILMVAKIWSAVDGLYLWEFITNLDYEWNIIRGYRTHNWTIWIYSTARLTAFMTVVLNLVAINSVGRIYNCRVEDMFQLIFGYLAVSSASLLILLRILAIWNKNRIVMVITGCTWVVSVVFTIQSIVRIRARWVDEGPVGFICELLDLGITKPITLVTLANNIVLLVIMFIGLLSNHLYESSTHGIGRLLWKQGLIWLLIATVAEVLPAVFICLNLNNPFDYIFQVPSVIAMAVAGTRIHRSLTEYAATSTFKLPRVQESFPSAPGAPAPVAVPLNHMEVAVHKTYRQYEMGLTNHQVSLVVAGGQPRNKPVARPVPDEEETTRASAETGRVTDAEVTETSNSDTTPLDWATDAANAA